MICSILTSHTEIVVETETSDAPDDKSISNYYNAKSTNAEALTLPTGSMIFMGIFIGEPMQNIYR